MNYQEVDILLIEDNPYDAALAIRELRKQNLVHHLVHVRDGAEALDFLYARGAYADRCKEIVPKVILLDLNMPRVDGLEVLEHIRSQEYTRFVPVVIMTSSTEDLLISRCYELGANSYLVKPVEFKSFIKALTDMGLYWTLLSLPEQE